MKFRIDSTAPRKRPWLALASVLLALTSFVSAQNADLSNLVPSAGTLDPAFDSATITYTAAVPFATTSITVTPTVAEVGATVTVNATPVTSGDASAPIALSVGPNVITTQVTSQDLNTTKTYTLTVTRGAASTNADLSALVPSAGTLDPVFDNATIAYAATVQFATSSMTVTPTTADATATITVNGNPVASGSPSDAIALSVGANIISTVVTAEDSSTTKNYTLTVTRAAVADLVTDFQATIASEEHPTYPGEARFFHVSTNPANPGTGSYAATIVGTNTPAPAFVRNFDGPVLAYKFAGGVNNDINAVAQQGGSLGGGIITFTTTDTTFDGFGQQQAKLWTSTDPGSDLKVTGPTSTDIYNAVPNTGSTGGWRSLSDATGKIDVTSIPAGSLHIYYGAFNAKPSVSIVMRDTALVDPAPNITIANAHLNNDTANRTEYYLAEIDFVTDGVYDEIEFVWNAGPGGNGRGIAVVVTEAVADAVAPTLVPAGIVDNVGGGPIISTGAAITYTVTYSEFMDPATIDASDFEIAGTASASIQSVVHFGGVTTVTVLPVTGTSGTLQLQVAAGAVLTDLAGNALDTTSAIADDPAITIIADVTPPTLVSITDNVSGGPVLEGQTVVYTVTFDEPMKASSIETTDFENGGSPAGVIAAVKPTANPAVYEVLASSTYPGGVGTLILQIKAGATLDDLSGNALNTGAALPDDVTITVNAQQAREVVPNPSFLAINPEQNDPASLTFDASASDKLVIIATKEGNANPFTTLTYEGQPLTLAVSTGSAVGNQHWQGIYYLDNPGTYDNGVEPVGQIVAVSGTSRNIITAVGLSNTAPGFGGSAAPAAPDNSKTVNLPVNFVGSMVIASHGMGQDGNTANVTTVNTTSPLVKMSAIKRGNNWVGHVTGYAASQGPGLTTYGFTGGSTAGVNTIAVEFPGALVVTDLFAAWKVLDGATGVTFEGDANDDGVQDGLAFLLGAANPNVDANAAGLLPTVTETAGGLVLNFNCLPTTARGTAKLYVQHSNALAAWTPSPTGVEVPDTNGGPTSNVTFVVGAGPAGPPALNSVTATIDSGAAAGGKLFGRLQATE